MRGFPGPRSSPTVADGKVVTLGVDGVLSCYDAASGRMLWRKEDEFGGNVPMFYTASSPIVVDGLCIAQLGGDDEGGIVAFDLTSGDEKWRVAEDSPAYGSPVLMSVGGTNLVIVPTEKNLMALEATDGKVKWEIPYEQGGRYNSATPIVSGDTLILAGPGSGMSAIKLAMQDGKLKEEKVWSNRDNSVQFNTPVLKDGLLFGLSNGGQLFCINTAKPEATAWAVPIAKPAAAGDRQPRASANGRRRRLACEATFVQLAPAARRGSATSRRRRRPRPGEGFRGGEGRGEGRGFGGRGGRRGGARRRWRLRLDRRRRPGADGAFAGGRAGCVRADRRGVQRSGPLQSGRGRDVCLSGAGRERHLHQGSGSADAVDGGVNWSLTAALFE